MKGKAMEVCLNFVGVYCGDVFQYIVEDCAQELVFWKQREQLPWIAVKEEGCLPFPGKSGP